MSVKSQEFGISGILEHWQSTAAGILVILLGMGVLSQETCNKITEQLPSIAAGISAIAGIIMMFYKGKSANPEPSQAEGPGRPAPDLDVGPGIIKDKGESKQ